MHEAMMIWRSTMGKTRGYVLGEGVGSAWHVKSHALE